MKQWAHADTVLIINTSPQKWLVNSSMRSKVTPQVSIMTLLTVGLKMASTVTTSISVSNWVSVCLFVWVFLSVIVSMLLCECEHQNDWLNVFVSLCIWLSLSEILWLSETMFDYVCLCVSLCMSGSMSMSISSIGLPNHVRMGSWFARHSSSTMSKPMVEIVSVSVSVSLCHCLSLSVYLCVSV